ncbi:TetR/AcrR family transcriptional regulator [Bryobacter aggregatus]|uniref:TetR/AcrR family transcriptional regulator n=1 Tax=Bryobacter aggregatus TaxID=360054 RepID=UPI0004E1AC0D|nr:TetR/AcrR family transcriptional regulator [Bryobacter aggregatus]
MSLLPRLSSQQRRCAILDAAIRLFSGRGFRGVTTRELAASVGVSEPVLYQHFPSKKDLYTAILEASKDQGYVDALSGLARVASGSDDREFFTHLAREMIVWHETKPELIRLKLFSALEGHESMDELNEKQHKPFLDIITGYIQRRIEEGAFTGVQPLGAALAFCGMIGQYCQNTILFKSPLCSTIEREEMVNLTVQIFLNGIVEKNS